MTKEELCETLSSNIKKYRKGFFTQETLAEKVGLSAQQINGIEGGRKWVSVDSLVRIADALGVEVYQLFIPKDKPLIEIEETPEIELIRSELEKQIYCDVRKSFNKMIDKMEERSIENRLAEG